MIRTVLIDDERPALRNLEHHLSKYKEIEIVGQFTNEIKGIARIKQGDIDLIFLDIEMPKMKGIEVADKILSISKDTQIIFVTAYDNYALDAFEVNALDYIMKPVSSKRLDKTIDRVLKSYKNEIGLYIQCLGGLEYRLENGEIIKWRTKKAEELFALLLHYQGKGVSREIIMDILWPEMDIKKASNNLYTTSYYIRKTLEEHGFEDMLDRDKEKYCLKIKPNQVDFIEFSNKVEQIDNNNISLEELLEISKIYKGQYMKDKGYEWANTYVVWFENAYTKVQFEIAKRQYKENNIKKSSDSLKILIHYNPFYEKAYEKLIEILIELKDYISVKKYYNDYLIMMKNELGLKPSNKLKKIIKNII